MTKEITNSDKIFLTGGSGFIGGYIVDLLCYKGYKVRVHCRNLKEESKYIYLKKFERLPNQIEFVDGEYANCLNGITGIVHLASPYIYSAQDPDKEIVQPAIQSVKDIMLAAAKFPAVKRVVLTSSGGAIFSLPHEKGKIYSDKDWNQTSTLSNNPYFLSKKLAEQAFWELSKSSSFDCVVVNPTLVLGPLQNERWNASQQNFSKFLTGEHKQVTPGTFGICDVRDVAMAHLIALENIHAKDQRLIVVSSCHSFKQLVLLIRKFAPSEYPVTPSVDDEEINIGFETKLTQMGMTSFTKFEKMVEDMVESWIRLKLVSPPAKN